MNGNMNLTVLELGLKNRQISTVKCFLRIQTETFRQSISQQNLDITSIELIGKHWDSVFSKLISIINASINDKSSQDFALTLSRIAFKTLSLLLIIISETQFSEHFPQIRALLNSIFTRNNRLLKNALKLDKTGFNDELIKFVDSGDNLFELSNDRKPDHMIEASILNSCVVLAQHSLKKRNNFNVEWNYIIEKVIQLYLSDLNEQNSDLKNTILNNLGLDLPHILNKIYTFTTSASYRKMISNNCDSNNILLVPNLDETHSFHIQNLIDNNDYSLSLNINLIISMQIDLQQRIFLWRMFQNKHNISHNFFDASIAWNYLIDKNDFNKLIYWMEHTGDSDVNAFPFKWSIDDTMIESINDRASIYAKEMLLNKLCKTGTFSQTESNDFQCKLHRIGRVDVFDSHFSSSFDSIQFSQAINICNSDDFVHQLINHCINFKLFDCLYNFRKNLSDVTFNPFNNLTTLLDSSIKLVNNSNDNILKMILETAQYIYDMKSPVTIKSLIDCGHIYLALIAITYDSLNYCELFSEDSNNSTNSVLTINSMSANILKTRYPILYQSFFHNQCEQLSVYMLLKDTVPFDISKMFCWQSFNNIQNCDDDMCSSIVYHDLPHFSHNKLANLYGLKANLSFIYYLNQGRVMEAYNKVMSNKKKSNAKYLENACKRAALLAYNDTSEQRIIVSCIVFQQLLMNEFSQTSIHLAIANIIMDYSSEFLGLNVRHQHLQLSRLLKRAQYYNDKRASAKLLQLINAALTRKYKHYNNMQIEECFDWKIPLKFVQFNNCEIPLEFLIKCANADDWLMFTVFCQLHDCPKEQVMVALKHFSNQCISEHLTKAFQSSNSKLYDIENRLLGKTERHPNTSAKYLRSTLYRKLRIHKPSELDSNRNLGRNSYKTNSYKTSSNSIDNDDQSIASESESNAFDTISAFSSSSNDNNNDNEEPLKFSAENIPKEFFQVILNYCHSDYSGDPIKPLFYLSIPLSNPLLCLIGSSVNHPQYKNLNPLNIFLCWLLSSVDFDIRRQFCEQNDNYDALNASLDDNYRLLDIVMRDIKTHIIFLRGLKIFNINVTPIRDLLLFTISFFYEKNYYDVQNLKSFQDNLWKYQEPNKIENNFYCKEWIQRSSVIILNSCLKIANNYELRILLRHYDISRIQGTFSPEINVPNFRKIYRVFQILSETNVKLRIEEFLALELLNSNGNRVINEQYCLGIKKIALKLQQNNYFSEATQFANVSGIEIKDINDIVMNEWILKAATNMDSIDFWYTCWNSLVAADSSLIITFKVFKKYINQVSSILVKCFLIFKCVEACVESKIDSSQFEAQLWKCVIDIESETQTKQTNFVQWNEFWDHIICFFKTNRNFVSNLSQIDLSKYANTKSHSLDNVIGKLLNNGCIESARRIAVLFGYSSKELDITLTCYSIAKGEIKNLSEAPLSVQLKTKSANISSTVKYLSDKFNCDQKEKIEFIEMTCKLEPMGQKACQRILLYYKIACLLDIDFSDIDKTKLDDLNLLKCLISFNSNEALNFAKELILLNKISDEEVATIICNVIISKLNSKNDKLRSTSSDSSLTSLVDSVDFNFISILGLLNNTPVLGYKLIKATEENSLKSSLLLTEIYICAHQCFTDHCDVKGIALVLSKTRSFINGDLLEENDFNSILRLLSGIGRYSEMTYCFDIILKYYHYELLLSKRIEKVPQLRIALLDYLKDDKELYLMFARRFCLYRHIAENCESKAREILENLKLNNETILSIDKNQTEKVLNDALEELINAEINYTEEKCHVHAATCAKFAQLIALQIHYLSKNIILINLKDFQISSFIENCSNFYESLIVADAYQHHTSWANAIINNVIKKNNLNYLSEFNAHLGINNSSLIEEISHKYKQLTKNLNELTQYKTAMKKLIQYIDDIKTKYKLSLVFNIEEISNQMLKASNSAYLKDLRTNNQL